MDQGVVSDSTTPSTVKRYVLHGTVFPEFERLWATPHSFEALSADGSVHLRLKFSISLSKVTAVAELVKGDLDPGALRNSVEYAVRRMIDAIGFSEAAGFDLDLYSVMEDDNPPLTLGVRVDELQEEAKTGVVTTTELYERALTSPELTAALADLREAIRQPLNTGFYCYRAVEALRGPFETAGATAESSWKAFRAALRVDEVGLKTLAEHSKRERHGKQLQTISSAFRVKAMRYSRTIVERFVTYERTQKPLPNDVPDLVWPPETEVLQ